MASVSERLNHWVVELRWRWIETTWHELIYRMLGWLGVFVAIGAGGWWIYSCRSSAEDLTSLTADLRNRSPNIREHAYRILEKRDDAAGPFAHALRDDRPEVRLEAAQALAEYPHSIADAVPTLIDALDDPDPQIRYLAVKALGRATDRPEEASLALHRVMENDQNDAVAEYAGIALRDLGKK